MTDEVFSRSGGVRTHCLMPVPHLNLKMAEGRKKPMKLLLLFTEVVVVMIMAFRAEKAKHAELPNEKENIKTNRIFKKKRGKKNRGTEIASLRIQCTLL